MACALELLVFAMVDPQNMHWSNHQLEFSPEGIYTVAFFAFWLIASLGAALTVMLAMPPSEVNRLALPDDVPSEMRSTQEK